MARRGKMLNITVIDTCNLLFLTFFFFFFWLFCFPKCTVSIEIIIKTGFEGVKKLPAQSITEHSFLSETCHYYVDRSNSSDRNLEHKNTHKNTLHGRTNALLVSLRIQ
jgi:hypothetical protein